MSFSHLSSATGRPGTAGSQTLSGKQIATELTNELNKSFGDDNVFDFAALSGKTLTIKRYPVGATALAAATQWVSIPLSGAGGILELANAEVGGMTFHDGTGTILLARQLVGRSQRPNQLLELWSCKRKKAAWTDVTVEYDEKNQGFMVHQSSSLKATPDIIRLGGSNAGRTLFWRYWYPS